MEGFVAAGNERNAAEPMEVGRKKEKKPGCWSYLGFSCVSSSSKAKVDNSMSNTSAVHAESKSTNEGCMDQPVAPVVSESAVMTFSLESILSIPKVGGHLRIASQLRRFTFNELKSATRDFKPESLLGEGGFGCVFKGWIEPNGTAPVTPGTGLTVAVKTLNHSGIQGHKEWVAEVKYLGDLLHPNLVKLIGYCIEDDHRMLVYEFMAQGSLENHLFRKGPLPLSWSFRMKIALGVAKGLAFLHEETERPVIYRDFKAANILLDDNYNAKLSDFGLAIDGPEGDETHITTPVMGTPGYADPDYVTTGHLTSKSDVYSFGVFLLEMLTGRRSMDKSLPRGDQNLVDWAWPILSDQSRLYQLMDPRLEGCFSIRGVIKTAQLAQHCLSREPKIRPLMSEVVQDLQPLVNLKDMDTTVFFRQIMHAERAAAIRYSLRAQSSFPRNREGRGKQPMRSLSNGVAMLGSPYRQLPPRPNGQQS